MKRREAVEWDPDTPSHRPGLRAVEAAARDLGLRLQALPVSGPAEYDSAFAAMTNNRAEAVLVLSTPVYTAGAAPLAALLLSHPLPYLVLPHQPYARRARVI